MKFTECLQKFDKKLAVEMMQHGKSQAEIGKQFGISAQRVSDCFKALKIPYIRRTFYVNDTYFDKINSEEKAYILGFLVADGCVKEEIRKNKSSWRIAFCNSIDDAEIINLIHDRICPEANIVIPKIKHNRRKKKQYILQWTSEHMCKTLSKYNIIPRKTYDKSFKLPENLLTDELWRHFIRGFFDGDGHVGDCTVEFVFTSELFMNQIMNWFKNFNYRIYHIEGKTTDYWKVVIPTNRKIKSCIYHYLYDGATCYLTRKHDVFNTEITYSLKHKTIDIVEHRVEKI